LGCEVIDNFSILLSHALLAFALWHLINRSDLDVEEPPATDTEPEGFARQRRPQPGKRQSSPDA
jgi:hypothetical protein